MAQFRIDLVRLCLAATILASVACGGSGHSSDGGPTDSMPDAPGPDASAHDARVQDGGDGADASPPNDAATVDATGGDPDAGAEADAGATHVLTDAMEIAAGGAHTCARLADSTVRCWGSNSSGELGDGTMAMSSSTPVEVAGLSGVVQLAVGDYHTCALLTDGTMRCWGDNQWGQLGDGTWGTARRTPVATVGLTGIAEIAAGASHTCARLTDDTLHCWGMNVYGTLGSGAVSSDAVPAPTTVIGLSAWSPLTLDAGVRHTCIIVNDGASALCWGDNASGQLGDGTMAGSLGTIRPTPTTVSGSIRSFSQIAVGAEQSCARLTDGSVVCWGGNTFGSVGDGTSGTSRLTPVLVRGLSDARHVAAGTNHTCACLVDGTVYCWGFNSSGQLGDGTSGENRLMPVSVVGLTTASEISAGSSHTCARLVDATVRCWGSNARGQLGDGTTMDRLISTTVTAP